MARHTMLRTLCTLSLCISGALSHMQMSQPSPLRDPHSNSTDEPKDYNILTPLRADGSDFSCKGYQWNTPLTSVATYDAGSTYEMKLMGGATHGGGSCQIAMSYDNGVTFKVIKSMEGDCPTTNTYEFTIPEDAPSGQALISWSWFNKVGNREMYQNCAVVTIVGADGGSSRTTGDDSTDGSEAAQDVLSSLPDMYVANLASVNDCKTKETVDVQFPDPGSDVVYGDGMSASSRIRKRDTSDSCTGQGRKSAGDVSSSSSSGSSSSGASSSGSSSGSSDSSSSGSSDSSSSGTSGSSSSSSSGSTGDDGQWHGGSQQSTSGTSGMSGSSDTAGSSSTCADANDGQYHPECIPGMSSTSSTGSNGEAGTSSSSGTSSGQSSPDSGSSPSTGSTGEAGTSSQGTSSDQQSSSSGSSSSSDGSNGDAGASSSGTSSGQQSSSDDDDSSRSSSSTDSDSGTGDSTQDDTPMTHAELAQAIADTGDSDQTSGSLSTSAGKNRLFAGNDDLNDMGIDLVQQVSDPAVAATPIPAAPPAVLGHNAPMHGFTWPTNTATAADESESTTVDEPETTTDDSSTTIPTETDIPSGDLDWLLDPSTIAVDCATLPEPTPPADQDTSVQEPASDNPADVIAEAQQEQQAVEDLTPVAPVEDQSTSTDSAESSTPTDDGSGGGFSFPVSSSDDEPQATPTDPNSTIITDTITPDTTTPDDSLPTGPELALDSSDQGSGSADDSTQVIPDDSAFQFPVDSTSDGVPVADMDSSGPGPKRPVVEDPSAVTGPDTMRTETFNEADDPSTTEVSGALFVAPGDQDASQTTADTSSSPGPAMDPADPADQADSQGVDTADPADLAEASLSSTSTDSVATPPPVVDPADPADQQEFQGVDTADPADVIDAALSLASTTPSATPTPVVDPADPADQQEFQSVDTADPADLAEAVLSLASTAISATPTPTPISLVDPADPADQADFQGVDTADPADVEEAILSSTSTIPSPTPTPSIDPADPADQLEAQGVDTSVDTADPADNLETQGVDTSVDTADPADLIEALSSSTSTELPASPTPSIDTSDPADMIEAQGVDTVDSADIVEAATSTLTSTSSSAVPSPSNDDMDPTDGDAMAEQGVETDDSADSPDAVPSSASLIASDPSIVNLPDGWVPAEVDTGTEDVPERLERPPIPGSFPIHLKRPSSTYNHMLTPHPTPHVVGPGNGAGNLQVPPVFTPPPSPQQSSRVAAMIAAIKSKNSALHDRNKTRIRVPPATPRTWPGHQIQASATPVASTNTSTPIILVNPLRPPKLLDQATDTPTPSPSPAGSPALKPVAPPLRAPWAAPPVPVEKLKVGKLQPGPGARFGTGNQRRDSTNAGMERLEMIDGSFPQDANDWIYQGTPQDENGDPVQDDIDDTSLDELEGPVTENTGEQPASDDSLADVPPEAEAPSSDQVLSDPTSSDDSEFDVPADDQDIPVSLDQPTSDQEDTLPQPVADPSQEIPPDQPVVDQSSETGGSSDVPAGNDTTPSTQPDPLQEQQDSPEFVLAEEAQESAEQAAQQQQQPPFKPKKRTPIPVPNPAAGCTSEVWDCAGCATPNRCVKTGKCKRACRRRGTVVVSRQLTPATSDDGDGEGGSDPLGDQAEQVQAQSDVASQDANDALQYLKDHEGDFKPGLVQDVVQSQSDDTGGDQSAGSDGESQDGSDGSDEPQTVDESQDQSEDSDQDQNEDTASDTPDVDGPQTEDQSTDQDATQDGSQDQGSGDQSTDQTVDPDASQDQTQDQDTNDQTIDPSADQVAEGDDSFADENTSQDQPQDQDAGDQAIDLSADQGPQSDDSTTDQGTQDDGEQQPADNGEDVPFSDEVLGAGVDLGGLLNLGGIGSSKRAKVPTHQSAPLKPVQETQDNGNAANSAAPQYTDNDGIAPDGELPSYIPKPRSWSDTAASAPRYSDNDGVDTGAGIPNFIANLIDKNMPSNLRQKGTSARYEAKRSLSGDPTLSSTEIVDGDSFSNGGVEDSVAILGPESAGNTAKRSLAGDPTIISGDIIDGDSFSNSGIDDSAAMLGSESARYKAKRSPDSDPTLTSEGITDGDSFSNGGVEDPVTEDTDTLQAPDLPSGSEETDPTVVDDSSDTADSSTSNTNDSVASQDTAPAEQPDSPADVLAEVQQEEQPDSPADVLAEVAQENAESGLGRLKHQITKLILNRLRSQTDDSIGDGIADIGEIEALWPGLASSEDADSQGFSDGTSANSSEGSETDPSDTNMQDQDAIAQPLIADLTESASTPTSSAGGLKWGAKPWPAPTPGQDGPVGIAPEPVETNAPISVAEAMAMAAEIAASSTETSLSAEPTDEPVPNTPATKPLPWFMGHGPVVPENTTLKWPTPVGIVVTPPSEDTAPESSPEASPVADSDLSPFVLDPTAQPDNLEDFPTVINDLDPGESDNSTTGSDGKENIGVTNPDTTPTDQTQVEAAPEQADSPADVLAEELAEEQQAIESQQALDSQAATETSQPSDDLVVPAPPIEDSNMSDSADDGTGFSSGADDAEGNSRINVGHASKVDVDGEQEQSWWKWW